MKFLLSNSKSEEELKKCTENNTKIKNDKLFYPFTLKYQLLKNISIFSEDKSLFILISNDVILVPNEPIYHNEKLSDYFSFSQIEGDICCDTLHMIMENDCFNNKFSIIKIYDENFNFENHFEIPDDSIDFDSVEKFYYNEKNEEESCGITINKERINDKESINPLSPIYVKKDDKLFLIGIINKYAHFYIFDKDELIKIKNKMEDFEFKIKLYQIKKLDFSKQTINNEELHFIFQNDLRSLEYLDLGNNIYTNIGIKALQNKSLRNIKYLNLSYTNITDSGLKCLNELENLNELVLLNMNKLSNNYFLSLQEIYIDSRLKNLNCDKKVLTIKKFNDNFENYNLPNLTTLKIFDESWINHGASVETHLILKKLFPLNNLYKFLVNY